MIPLDILSDPICPWCYIGKAQLDAALAQRPTHPFVITWHPYQLNPTMAPEGMDRRAYLEAKFGGRDGAIKVYGQIAEAAAAAGLEIDFARITRTPNTLDAHRMIHWAELEGRQSDVVDALFRAYFVEGRDISAHSELVAIAEAAGLDGPLIAQLLAGDGDRDEVTRRDASAREMGAQGVPTFVVARQHALSGAQPTELWLKVIDEIASGLAAD